MPGVIQRLRMQLDLASIDAMRDQVERAAKEMGQVVADEIAKSPTDAAGKKAALNAFEGLASTFRSKAAELQKLVEAGLLTAEAARTKGREAAREYADAVAKEVKKHGGVLGASGQRTILASLRSSLGLDPKMYDEAPKAAEKVGVLTKGLGFLKTQLIGLVAPLAAFFSARALLGFGKGAITEFQEDTKALNDLRVTVERTGKSFHDLAPEIERVGTTFARTGRASGSDFNRTLSTLIGVSGDYENSLKNVGLATDFAAKHNISLEQATDLVGKAMTGNARGLREFAIEAKKGDDAILLMRKDAEGFVAQQGPTFAKAVNILSFAWNDFKSAVGEALIEAGGGTSILDTLSAAIVGLTKWVKENKGELRAWATDGLREVNDLIRNTAVEVLKLRQTWTLVTASFNDLDETTTRLNASWLEFRADLLDVTGWDAAAKAAREAAADLRKQADALRDLAKARREEAKALGEAAERTARGPRPTSPSEKTTWHGGPSRAGEIPTGGRATSTVHSLEGDGGTDPEIERIRLLSEGIKLDATRERSLAALAVIEARLTKELKDGNLALDERLKREAKRELIDKAITERLRPLDEVAPVQLQPRLPLRLGEVTPGEQEAIDASARAGTPISSGPVSRAEIEAELVLTEQEQSIFRDRVQNVLREAGEVAPLEVPLSFEEDAITTVFENIGAIATDIASDIVDVFDDTFSKLLDGSESLGQSFLNLGKGLAHAILSQLAKLATGKVVENIANAIEEKARATAAAAVGNFPGAAAHTAAAAAFLSAAASWGAVATVAGLGSALTAGGGGGSGGGSDRSSERSDPQEKERQPATIVITGGLLNTDDTYQMDALAKAIKTVDGRDVVIKRG